MKICKDDNVMIVKGAHRGQSGKVIKVFPKTQRAIVEGRNLIKRHTRPSAKDQKGGIVEKEGSINVTNLMLICPKCNTPARTGTKMLADKRKVRTCKKCKEMVE